MGLYLNILKEAIITPRQSARRILDQALETQNLILLFLTGYAVSAFFAQVTFALVDQEGMPVPPITIHIPGIILTAILVPFIAGLVWGIGQSFGGKGEFDGAVQIVVWQFFLTSFLTPLEVWAQLNFSFMEDANAIDLNNTPPMFVVMLCGVYALKFYIFVNFIAELHGFKSAAKIAVSLVGVSLLVMTIFGALFVGR